MNRNKLAAVLLTTLCLGVPGCKGNDIKSEKSSIRDTEGVPQEATEEEEDGYGYADMAAPAPEPSIVNEQKLAKRSIAEKPMDALAVGGMMKGKDKGGSAGPGGGGGEQGPAPRAWFPETFLFEPAVVTDESGNATVRVKVPDRLTSWRVLGLAHSRNGSQAGAVTAFEGTLPAYVDPVVPSFLRVGDVVRVPIQLVNTTDETLTTPLVVEVEGGELKTRPQSLSIAGKSSIVRYVEVTATSAGTMRLMARMGDDDMVVRTVDVVPSGRPVRESKSGTLAAPRTLTLTGAESDGVSKGVANLTVYAGALALVRSELGAAVHREGVAEDAFALLVAGKAPEILRALGDVPNDEELRTLSLTAAQNVVKHARVLSIENAALIAEAAASHPENPVLDRLATRALSTIESAQSPDGTCGGASGWTLQRMLVSTADCARAAHELPNVTIRASGAFERNAKEISDAYTAAAILASDSASGALAESLRKTVLAGIETSDDGSKFLKVPAGVVRADGHRPSVVEATALAVLALREAANAPLADLGATILASYSPLRGWGDGRANLVCMEAAVELFSEPLPARVKLSLLKDGDVVAEGALDKESIREAVRLHAEDLDVSGEHEWKVVAEPAVAGLGFSLAVQSWVPWTERQALGSDLSVTMDGAMKVGNASVLSVSAVVPSGQSFSIDLDLASGVQVDKTSLEALVAEGVLRSYSVVDGRIELEAHALQPAQRFAAPIRVIPTLAGTVQTGATHIEVGRERGYLPPMTFKIAP